MSWEAYPSRCNAEVPKQEECAALRHLGKKRTRKHYVVLGLEPKPLYLGLQSFGLLRTWFWSCISPNVLQLWKHDQPSLLNPNSKLLNPLQPS